jgi:hypothetical protein
MEKKTENKLYTIIGIIGLLSIVGFVIYLIGSFIYFGVKTTYDNYNRPTTYINSCDNVDILEPDNNSSRPVKGMYANDSLDSLDSLHIPHVIFDKELNCYAISLAGNKLEDIANYDKLVEQMNRLQYNRNKYKDCTIEDIELVGTHYIDNIHQAAESIRYNLSHKDNPYNEGYDAGYDAGYETAKRELENN